MDGGLIDDVQRRKTKPFPMLRVIGCDSKGERFERADHVEDLFMSLIL